MEGTTDMSPAARDLALCIINDPRGYPERQALGRQALALDSPPVQAVNAAKWLAITVAAANDYTRQFGCAGETRFSTPDLLKVAAYLADYYLERAREDD